MPQQGDYSSIVYFGDSLSDNGNFNALAADFFKPGYSVPFQYAGPTGDIRTYSDTSFTDGVVYADTLAGLLSLGSAQQNYAFGGAQATGSKTGDSYILEYSAQSYTALDGTEGTFSLIADPDAALAAYGDFDINLSAQVTRFLDDHAAAGGGYDIADGTLAVLNIGANDLGTFEIDWLEFLFFGQMQRFADNIADEIELQARRLADAGVDNIALYTLPIAKLFVAYDDADFITRELAEELVDKVNDEIRARAAELNGDGITTEIVRMDIIARELVVDRQSFGFLAKGPYLLGYGGDPEWVETPDGIIPVFEVNTELQDLRADQILFFDEIHPSGALHDVIAVFSNEALTAQVLFGTQGHNNERVYAGEHFVMGQDGHDTLDLGAGDDTALGGRGNDSILGRNDSDLLIGGRGRDTLKGGSGADLLEGGLGDDKLQGGKQNDILIGGLGSDTLSGGNGKDVFIFIDEALQGGSGDITETFKGGWGQDVLHVFLEEGTSLSTSNGGDRLSFGGTVLNLDSIHEVVVHHGMPVDADSLNLSGDMADRFDEAQLWNIA